MGAYLAGSLVSLSASFKDSTGTAVDPSTVSFSYQVGGGSITTLTYTSVTTPAPGVVAKTAVGTYVLEVDTTGQPGIWYWSVTSTGVGQAAGDGAFTVSEVRP